MSLTTVTASEIKSDKKGKHLDITKRYRYAQPIVFVERGVEFFVFPDGSFDFNTNFEDSFYNDTYYKTRNSKRSRVNATSNILRNKVKYTSPRQRGVSISRDRSGKVKRIGNVFLNYDRRGKLTRVGSVYMDYKHGKGVLTQVGGLKVKYNHWGEILFTRGQVKHFNDDWKYRHYKKDSNHYYYKHNGKVKKHKKSKR